jgi:predicted metalloprotease
MRWEGEEQSSNVEDRRMLGPKTMAAGGLGTLLLLVAGYFLGVDPSMLQQLFNQGPDGNGQVEQRPETADEKRTLAFTSTVLRFTEVVWDEQFRRIGKTYEKPHMVLFSRQVETGCGTAPSAVGPFYCPRDRTVYLDPTFFDELQQKLGGSKAEFSQAYVIAHEVGHHVQHLLGFGEIVDAKRQSLPKTEFNKWSVRLELQADYLAGVWAHYGQEKFKFIEPGDVETAIQTANAIGDDRLQRRARGFVSPEQFTHGRSEQRVRWFREGLTTGDLKQLKQIFDMPYDDL